MSLDLTAALTSGVAAGIGRGFVVGVDSEAYTYRISTEGGDLEADVLVTSAARVLPGVGEEVLFWHSGECGERAVILGCIACDPQTKRPAESIVLNAAENLTLKCGDGSITIRKDGKILIKGKDLVSQAKRTNRIRGGSVAIN